MAEAPKNVLQPGVSSNDINTTVSFSYYELELQDVFTIENRKYLSFFVDKEEDSFYIQCLRSEFLEYQSLFFDKLEEQLSIGDEEEDVIEEGEEMFKSTCTCDECTVRYERLEDVKVEITLIDEQGNKEELKNSIPVYHVENLLSGFRIGICNI